MTHSEGWLTMTGREPLRMVQQAQGQRGFEVWHQTVRRYDPSDRSDTNSACASLNSNVIDRERAKYAEHCDYNLRTFINETNK